VATVSTYNRPKIYNILLLLFNCNGLSPGGSSTTIRQQTIPTTSQQANNTHKHVQTKHSTHTLVEKHDINRKLT
jgi:hypothetical protein